MRKIIITGALVLMLSLLIAIPVIVAFTPTKTYDSVTKIITLKNESGDTIFKFTLQNYTGYTFPNGDYIYIDVENSYQKTAIFNKPEFKPIKNTSTLIGRKDDMQYLDRTAKYKIPKYKEECDWEIINSTNTSVCRMVLDGDEEKLGVWKEFKEDTSLELGITNLRFWVQVHEGEKIDMIPQLTVLGYNISLIEWATLEAFTKYEWYIVNNDNSHWLVHDPTSTRDGGSYQVFQIGATGTNETIIARGVSVLIGGVVGHTWNVSFWIYNTTSANCTITGDYIAWGEGSFVGEDSYSHTWLNITFAVNGTLNQGESYCLRGNSSGAIPNVGWGADATSGAYAGGQGGWYNGAETDDDMMFEIWGTTATPPNEAPTSDFVSQTPATVTSTNLLNQILSVVFNSTDADDGINISNVRLVYKVNSSTGAWLFTNGIETKDWQTKTGTNVSLDWTFVLDENIVYPATYIIDEEITEEEPHFEYNITNQNQYMKLRLFNVSNDKEYSFFEIMADNRTANSASAGIFYCNSTYEEGNPVLSDNCINFYNIEPEDIWNHTHQPTNISSHYVIPFAYDGSGILGDVAVTPTSYFLIRGNIQEGWKVSYVLNSSRVDNIQLTTNNGNAWTNFSGTIDSHLHQYDGTDTLNYLMESCDYTDACTNSSIQTAVIQLSDLPPTAPDVFAPIERTYTTEISINYTASSAGQNAISFYNISLVDESEDYIQYIHYNALNLSYLFDSSGLTDDTNYKIRVEVCNNISLCEYGYSTNFTIDFDYSLAPVITITRPGNWSYGFANATALFKFNWTVSDLDNYSTCQYAVYNESQLIIGNTSINCEHDVQYQTEINVSEYNNLRLDLYMKDIYDFANVSSIEFDVFEDGNDPLLNVNAPTSPPNIPSRTVNYVYSLVDNTTLELMTCSYDIKWLV